ncbi:MAG: type II toxin-antitoxin system RelE/ParE family toxin [Bacillota bacterium]
MKSYKVLITRPAIEDLRSIADYIATELKEPSTAKKLIGKIKEAIMSLGEMPARHPLVADEDLAAQGIRWLMVDNYMVFYVVSEKNRTVVVIRILYGRRDWINLLRC